MTFDGISKVDDMTPWKHCNSESDTEAVPDAVVKAGSCITNENDAWCSYYRYPDFQRMWERGELTTENYSEVMNGFCGKRENQNRNYKCANRISNMQAKTYISYWTDLQQAFGSQFNSWKKAQNHWEEFGFNEGRAYLIEGATEPSSCADEGGTCNCMGDITYGVMKNSDDPDIAKNLQRATFAEALQWNSVTIDGRNGADVACNNPTFGDPLPGLQKQCFCEAPARRIPTRIAVENEDKNLTCNGYMIYAQKSAGGQQDLLIEEAVQNYPFHILRPDVASRGFRCNNDDIGLDPVPGQQKACWCDNSKTAWFNVTEVEYYLATFKAQREAYVRQQEMDAMQAQIEQARIQQQIAEQQAQADLQLLYEQQRAADAAAEQALYDEKMALLQRDAEADQRAAAQAQKELDAAQAIELEAQRQRLLAKKNRAKAKAAEAKAAAASQIEAKQLIADALKAKNEAKKQEMQAALDAAKAEKAKADAERKKAKEKAAREAALAAAQIEAIQARDEEIAQAAADAAKAKADALKAKTMAANRAAEASRTQEAVNAAVQAALEEARKLKERQDAAVAAAYEAEKQKRRDEQDRQARAAAELVRQQIEAQKAADAEAEKQRKAAAAAEAAEKQRLKEEEAEQARLAEEARLQEIARLKAEHEAAAAKKAAELAANEEEQRKAEEQLRLANEAKAKAEVENARIEAAKQKLQAEQAASDARRQAAEQAKKEADEKQARAEKRTQQLKRQKAMAIKREQEERAEAERKDREHVAKLKAEKEADIARIAAAAAAHAEALRVANEANKRAMEDAKAARAAQEEKQAKDLAEKLAARRTKFAGQFEHVWIDGDTQISMVQVTLSDGSQIDNLIDAMMWDNMFADCDVVKEGMSRMFLRGGKEVIEDSEIQLIFTTANDRLDELKAVVAEKLPNTKHDLLVTTPATGNVNYIQYVNDQTKTRVEAAAAAEVKA